MAPGGSPPQTPRWRALIEAQLGRPQVRLLRQAFAAYAGAGGGLLAAGLAYTALFALIPGILLILGIAGMLLGEGELHDQFVDNVVEVLPPLQALLAPAVDELASRSGSMTAIGAIGLAWGASRFYDAFEGAMARVFGGLSRRGFLEKTALGLLSIAVLGAAFGLMTTLAGVRAFVEAAAGSATPIAGMAGVILDLAGPAATFAAISLVYRMVPPRQPSWRAIAGPAAVVTIALLALARLFVFLAPRLIGAAAVLGTLATVFAALAWLALAFQAVLLGAGGIDAIDREIRRLRGTHPDGKPAPMGDRTPPV
jgi:YihY family inner membrane protein